MDMICSFTNTLNYLIFKIKFPIVTKRGDMKRQVVIFTTIILSMCIASGAESTPDEVVDSSPLENLVEMKRAAKEKLKEKSAWADNVKLLASVEAAHSIAAALIVQGDSKNALKAAQEGVDSMVKLNRLPASASSDDDLPAPKDLKRANEIAESLKDFIKTKDRLYEPGNERNYYYSVDKKTLIVVNPVTAEDGTTVKSGSGAPVTTESEVSLEDH